MATTVYAAPDVDVVDIFTPTSLTGLQPTDITVEVFNYGDAGTFSLVLYIDGSYIATDGYSIAEGSYGYITYSFSYGYFSGGYHSLTVCSVNCITEGWTWSGTPDLELTDIYPPSSQTAGEDTVITAEIRNIGNADAVPFYLDMYIDDQFTADIYFSNGLPALSTGTANVTIPGGLPNGSYDIRFVADADSDIAESNEANNARTETFQWSGGTPDLELTEIYQPSSQTAGEDTIITAEIQNIGYADAVPFYVDMYIDDQFTADIYFSNGLPALSTGTVSITITGGLPNGSYDIRFVADADSDVAESNEANNARTETFQWSGGVPDLVLTDIYPPSSQTAGEDTVITAEIQNIGYADAASFYVDMYINGQLMTYVDFDSGLPALSTGTASITITGGLPNGSYDIRFVADADSEVDELSEANNNRTETFEWSGGIPDLELTDILSPTSLTAGEDTIITANITNIGYADAIPFNVYLYVDGQSALDVPISSGLDAWVYLALDINVTGGLSEGEHCFRFIADYYNYVSESNEDNNESTECFTWTEAPAVQPNPPTGVNAVAGPGSGDVTISWNLSGDTDVDYYRIHEGTSPGTYTYTYDHIPAEWNTGTIISELPDSITYYYAMTTVNTSGMESNLSNETNAMPVDTGDTEPPADPTNLTITDPGTGDELGLTWTASTDDTQVSHYLIYRLTNNSAVSEYSYDSEFPKYTTAASYKDIDLWDADTYYYKVLAVDEADNWSGLSNLASDSPDDNLAPSAVPYADIIAGNAVVDLWWSAPDTNTDGSYLDDLEGFNIYRGTVSGSYDPAPINGTYPYSGLDYTDTNVINGQTYYYVIKAVDYSGNESSASVEVSDTTDTLDDPPLAPANLSITEKDTELLLTWSPNYEDDLVGYNVYRGTTSGSYTLIAQIGIYEWYVDQNVQAGQTYYYVVTAEDEGGYESADSNEVSGMIGEGDIWIISPTSSNPATLDFLQSQSKMKISYDYNILQLLVSEIYMEISDAVSGNVVYKVSEWRPWDNSYFMWNGQYNVGPDQGKCVPDGWYDTKLYLEVFDFVGTYAETVEKRGIQVVNCLASMINVAVLEPDEKPITDNNFTFNSASPGVCNVTAAGTSGITSEDSKLEWSIDAISGSTITSSPSDTKGPNISFTYTGLPSLNSEFGNKTLTLDFPLVTGAPDTQTVEIFFSRDDTNNAGGQDPNWYYYWSQTGASSGNHQYDPVTPNYGYYNWGDPHFYIGTPASGINSWTGHDGIDTFAETCLHENQHKINYQTWWAPIGGYNAQLDQDSDYVLDSAEPALNLDPTKWDTDGDGWNDEHDIAYDAEFNWSAGSADSEDWSNPGHQSSK